MEQERIEWIGDIHDWVQVVGAKENIACPAMLHVGSIAVPAHLDLIAARYAIERWRRGSRKRIPFGIGGKLADNPLGYGFKGIPDSACTGGDCGQGLHDACTCLYLQ